MDITPKAYELIKKYAYKLAYNKNDYEDIAQIACELLVMNPPKPGLLPKNFYYTVVKRARSRFCFNQNSGGLKNQDILLTAEELDEDKLILRHPDEYNLENVYYIKEAIQRVTKIVQDVATPKEAEVFQLFIQEERDNSTRMHLSNIFQKIRQNY